LSTHATTDAGISPGNVLMVEDLTVAVGRKNYVNPVTGEAEPNPSTGERTIPKRTLSPTKASKAVKSFFDLRISNNDVDDKQKIWIYTGMIWKPDGERQIKNTIDAKIDDLSYEKGLQETLRRVRGMTESVDFDSNPYLFPALDKVIDLSTGVVRDYLPEDYLTYQYGATYDNPDADYRPILWFLCSSLEDPRDVLTALDIVNATFIRVAMDAIILLIGPGGNGKGVSEKILIALCTSGRVAVITISEAKASKFGTGAVIGKDLWIMSEVEDVKNSINILKKVSTGELTDSDTKYGGRIRGKPYVLPILDCNNPIEFGDDSWGRMRRVIKLDFPFRFDNVPGTRLKDPHLLDTVTSPQALSGLLKIIAARAPFLCKSRRIYNRKRPEQMNEEHKRQQNSLPYFCDACLTNSIPCNENDEPIDKNGLPCPKGEPSRLTTEDLYDEYKEYCTLFNVPVPADKGKVGKYIKEKFGVSSVPTTEKGQPIRYYRGLYLSKSAGTAYAEFSGNYTNYTETTEKLQEDMGENDVSRLLTTAEWPEDVIVEIEKMFRYILSCEDPQKISYNDYLQSAVVSVVPVVSNQEISIQEDGSVVPPVAIL